MNTVYYDTNETLVVAPPGLTELVRGNEQALVTQITPLFRERSVTLDCRDVRRIDAAGIAALISLYGAARQAGRHFSLCNVSARIAEILGLLGLDHILVSPDVDQTAPADLCTECPAA